MRQLHPKKGGKENLKGLFLLFYIAAVLGSPGWRALGPSLLPGLMGTLCQPEHGLEQLPGSSRNIFPQESQPRGAVSRHKSCIILCTGIAPGQPRARLCSVLWKLSTGNPVPVRDEEKMPWEQLPEGCGAAAPSSQTPFP